MGCRVRVVRRSRRSPRSGGGRASVDKGVAGKGERQGERELGTGVEGGEYGVEQGSWGGRELGKGKEYSKQYSGQASSTVPTSEVQQASKNGLSGEVQSKAGTASHRAGVGKQTYASAARTKTSDGANQLTAGDGRCGM